MFYLIPIIRWIRVEYNDVEVLIAENGWSDEGEMEDHDRIEYLRDHMAEVLKVLKNKESNLSGYLGKLKAFSSFI